MSILQWVLFLLPRTDRGYLIIFLKVGDRMSEEQWYSNKDLFEQINGLKEEMRETRSLIKQYNGLREKVDSVTSDVKTLKALNTGKAKVLSSIREWGGWIFALITLVILLKNNI